MIQARTALAIAALLVPASAAEAPAQMASAIHVVTVDNRDCPPTNSCTALIGTSWYSGFTERLHLAIANWNPMGLLGIYYPAPIADFSAVPVFGGPSYAYLVGPGELPLGAAFNVLTVRGAPSCLYMHTSTLDNIVGNTTFLDEPALNGHPDAFVLVLPYGLPTPTFPTTVGVYYDSFRLQWGIFNEDLTAMSADRVFTVYDDGCDVGLGTRYRLTCAGTTGNNCSLGGIAAGDPAAKILVTQRWEAAGPVYNPHPIGVYYAAGEWRVFNEDLASMPAGVQFNVAEIRVLLDDDFESGDGTAWSTAVP